MRSPVSQFREGLVGLCVLSTGLFMCSQSAWAAWISVDKTTVYEAFVEDEIVLVGNGQVRRAWSLLDNTSPGEKGEMSVRVFFEFDCGGKRLRSLQNSYYSETHARGVVLKATNTPGSWTNIVPDGLMDLYRKMVCR